MRVLFAPGPGDVVGTFRHWKAGRDDPNQTSVTWSAQFFDVCKALNICASVVSWNERGDSDADDQFKVVNRPKPAWTRRGGWRFHLGEHWHTLQIVLRAIVFRAHVVVVISLLQLFFFRFLRLFRIQLVLDFECVLWRKFVPISRAWRLIYRLERSVLRNQALAILSVSCDITQQLLELTEGSPVPILEYLPFYRRERLCPSPVVGDHPFRLLFVGRVETYKGTPVLVELARRFSKSNKPILIEVCGIGSALESVKGTIDTERLSSHLILHGYCAYDRLRDVYARCHAVIVPTTKEFAEGFNMVVAESVLAGKPVITSAVCPAVHYLGDAVLQVPVDDVDAYQGAVERLADDRDFYDRVRDAGAVVREQFFDPENSFRSALLIVFQSVLQKRRPLARTIALSESTGTCADSRM